MKQRDEECGHAFGLFITGLFLLSVVALYAWLILDMLFPRR